MTLDNHQRRPYAADNRDGKRIHSRYHERRPNRHRVDVEKTIREHARRDFALREEGVLSIVCPIADASGVDGIGTFNTPAETTRQIMDEDPAVQETIFSYEIHLCRSFPGDRLR